MRSAPRRLLGVHLLVGMLAGAVACARTTTTTTSSGSTAAVGATEVVDEGRAVFHGPGECYACHGGRLQGGPVAPPLRGPTFEDIDGSFAAIIHRIRAANPTPR